MSDTNKAFMLSTIDNPFNPFYSFDEWFLFDLEKGYNSCGLIARLANTSDQLTDSLNEESIKEAIEEIVSSDPFGIRIKVFKDDIIKPISIDELQNNYSIKQNKS